MSDEKEYYTAKETAEYLGIPMHRLARLRRQGRIKSIVPDSDPRYATYHISEIRKVDTSDQRRKKPGEEGSGSSSVPRIRFSALEAIGA